MRTTYIILITILFIAGGLILALKDKNDSDSLIPSRNDTVGEIIMKE